MELDPQVAVFGLLGVLSTLLGVLWRFHERRLEAIEDSLKAIAAHLASVDIKIAVVEAASGANQDRIKAVSETAHRFNAANIDDHRAIREWVTEKILRLLLGKQED